MTSPSVVTRHSSPHFKALPPLALYIHIPWCVRKCPYCDFNSHEARGAVPEGRYGEALLADLEQALPLVWGRRVYSVFFGGGTPSLFSARSIDAVLAAVRARLPLAPDAEITPEARGEYGFGYDPHFWIPSLGKCAAELLPIEKNLLSHRGQALRALVEKLK